MNDESTESTEWSGKKALEVGIRVVKNGMLERVQLTVEQAEDLLRGIGGEADAMVAELEALRAFREAVVEVAVKRQKGYADRRHGDVLNKECMDEVVAFCKLDSCQYVDATDKK